MRTLIRALALASVFFVIHAFPASGAVAQNTVGVFDPYPLRPADTSSPRDTLKSFLTSVRQATHAWRSGQPNNVVTGPRDRARDTLDFSELPARARLTQEIESILLLTEILGRIELPPDEEIPGDAEVQDQALTRWIIPNTRITLAKMEEGPRAGEFLFTADTVRNLEPDYRRAKNLPYKPDALVGIYDEVALSPGPMIPLAWFTALPAWLKTAFLDVALWQWLSFAILLAATSYLVTNLLRWGRRRLVRRQGAVVSRPQPRCGSL